MDLKTLLDDHQTGMSKFQDDYLVTLRAGGTLYGQYKQSLRELYKRFRGLRELTCKHERLLIDIDELEEKIKTEEGFELKRSEVDYTEKVMLTEESTRSINDTEREFKRFYQQASYLKEQIGDLTDEKRHQLDMEMWEFKVKEMAVIDLVTARQIRNVTYEFLSAMPKEMKRRIALELRDGDGLIEWYDTKEEYHLPDKLPEIEMPSIEKVLQLPSTIEFSK